jgi:hypothetical protein
MMVKSKPKPDPFAGRWRIVSMSAWEQDFVDEEEEGYFEFGENGQDCRSTTRDGEPAVEWTWDGNDEMDPVQGRGWAVVRGDELHGMVFFHGEFVAKKKGNPGSKTMRPKK